MMDLANFILDIHDETQDMDFNESKHIIEGAVNRLWKMQVDEWQLYKVYCAWRRVKITDNQATMDFAKLLNDLEDYYEHTAWL
jgi:hypothetical protein